jgi:hypothetical protein
VTRGRKDILISFTQPEFAGEKPDSGVSVTRPPPNTSANGNNPTSHRPAGSTCHQGSAGERLSGRRCCSVKKRREYASTCVVR